MSRTGEAPDGGDRLPRIRQAIEEANRRASRSITRVGCLRSKHLRWIAQGDVLRRKTSGLLQHESLRRPGNPGVVDLRDAVRAAVDRGRCLAGQNARGGASSPNRTEPPASVDLGDDPLPVRADIDRLAHALFTLGRGHVAARRDGRVAEVVYREERSLSDETPPCGVADPLRPADAPGGMTGLGLAVCRGIVEGYGGVIEVGSAPGGGTTVTIRFPLAAEDATVFAEQTPLTMSAEQTSSTTFAEQTSLGEGA
jgi:signal transduction histidine kinase